MNEPMMCPYKKGLLRLRNVLVVSTIHQKEAISAGRPVSWVYACIAS
jgi:hypothetical protein